jgi:hypothetical protein
MSDIIMTNRIVQIHLASWRYFAALTLPPLVLMFNLIYSVLCVPLLVLFLVTHYYCWRLYLDERLFTLLSDEEKIAEFEQGMAMLWAKKSTVTRSMTDRWRGTKVLFHRAMTSLLVLWLASICSVLYQALTLVD